MDPEAFARAMIERPWTALTGAGVSTASGLPDFRSPTGLWARHDPARVARADSIARDPALFWSLYRERFAGLAEAAPNPAHHILARWESRRWLTGVITQNVDGFHFAAGSRSVAEMHGRLEATRCSDCGTRVEYGRFTWIDDVPRCDECGGVMRPGVVLFDERLPEEAIGLAERLLADGAGVLCLGSSLRVAPVSGIPARVLDSGGRVVVVNGEPTPYALVDDDRCSSVVGDLGEWLAAVDRALPGE